YVILTRRLFSTAPPPPALYTLSLHDALPIFTASSAVSELTSHGIGSEMRPTPSRKRFRAPLSCSRIQRHTAAETIIGSSHGSSSSERRNPDSGNLMRK